MKDSLTLRLLDLALIACVLALFAWLATKFPIEHTQAVPVPPPVCRCPEKCECGKVPCDCFPPDLPPLASFRKCVHGVRLTRKCDKCPWPERDERLIARVKMLEFFTADLQREASELRYEIEVGSGP